MSIKLSMSPGNCFPLLWSLHSAGEVCFLPVHLPTHMPQWLKSKSSSVLSLTPIQTAVNSVSL